MVIKIKDESNDIKQKFLRLLRMAVLFVGLSVMFLQPSTADAHATLLEMEPAERVVAEEPPDELTLTFNEPIEHDLAVVTVYDSSAKVIFSGNPDDGVEKSPELAFSLPELDDGTYTVKWDVISADGHPVDGSYAFSIGEATEGDVKTVSGDDSSEGELILARIIPEGLLLLGAGLFWFGWLAERRGFPSVDTLWKKGRIIGAVFIILGTITELVTYGLSLPPGIIQVIFNGRWELLLQFPFVLMLFAQMLFLMLLFIPGMVRGWYLVLWMMVAVTPAFGGHVWGMKDPFVALVPRVIHQAAIAFWLGALCYIILLFIWKRKEDGQFSWRAFRPFYVYKMMAASGLVVLSGVVMVFLQTGITGVFTDWKSWSLIVIIKVVLTIAMLSMALFQTLKWKKTKIFSTGIIVRSEWIVGLAVIVLGVWMSQIAYPIAVESYDETLKTDDVEADVHIDKLQMGDREMIAVIPEFDGNAPEEVHVEVSMPQHDMGSGELTAEKNDSGDYAIELPFTMSGTWLLEMEATYANDETIEWADEMFIEGKGE